MVLVGEVLGRLSALERRAAGASIGPGAVAGVWARAWEFAGMWRWLVAEHEPVDDGAGCPGWRGALRRWPCGVWLAAHANLVRFELAVARATTPESVLDLPGSVGCRDGLGRGGGFGVRRGLSIVGRGES